MSSTDKIKELLDDFAEKEALAKAEISEIEDQIAELEERIVSSKERLESVAKDKEKVYLMRNRYAEGNWTDVLEKASERIKENEENEKNAELEAGGGTENDTVVSESDETVGDDSQAVETSDTLDKVPAAVAEVEQPTAPQEMEHAQHLEDQQPPSVRVPEGQQFPDGPAEGAVPQTELPSVPVSPANAHEQAPPVDVSQVQFSQEPAQQPVENQMRGHDVLPVALDNPEAPPILPGIPNPPTGFDAMQTPPGIANVPNMPDFAAEGFQQPQQQQQQQQGEAEQPESLFPFSQGHEMGGDMEQDSPWSAPPGMGWETSETSSQFPPGQPQPPVPPPQPGMQPPQPAPPQLSAQQQVFQQNQAAMPAQAPQPPQPPQQVENGGFDISDALKPEGEEEETSQKDDENVKKINDALRGLFS